MHVAVAVGTLVLGSWVLSSPEEEGTPLPEDLQVPIVSPDRPEAPYSPQMRPSRSDRMGGRRIPGAGGAQGVQDNSAGGRSVGRMPPQGTQGMPFSPTEVVAPGVRDALGQPTAPTTNVTTLGPAAFGIREPIPPTVRESMAPDSTYRPMSRSALDQGRGAPPLQNAGRAMTQPQMEKAFAGYRPTSGVSPYMNLFRRDNDGTIDNYTSLVRPQIEQRFLNQQIYRDIGGLERGAHSQNLDLQQLYRANQTLQGVGTPQYYMNYGNYYPGSGR